MAASVKTFEVLFALMIGLIVFGAIVWFVVTQWGEQTENVETALGLGERMEPEPGESAIWARPGDCREESWKARRETEDFVLASVSGGKVTVELWGGDPPVLIAEKEVASGGADDVLIVGANLDGDGKEEIVVVPYGTDDFYVLYREGDELKNFISPGSLGVVGSAVAITSGDFDGDLDDEIVVANSERRVYAYDLDGNSLDAQVVMNPHESAYDEVRGGESIRYLVAADIDGDQRDEVVVGFNAKEGDDYSSVFCAFGKSEYESSYFTAVPGPGGKCFRHGLNGGKNFLLVGSHGNDPRQLSGDPDYDCIDDFGFGIYPHFEKEEEYFNEFPLIGTGSTYEQKKFVYISDEGKDLLSRVLYYSNSTRERREDSCLTDTPLVRHDIVSGSYYDYSVLLGHFDSCRSLWAERLALRYYIDCSMSMDVAMEYNERVSGGTAGDSFPDSPCFDSGCKYMLEDFPDGEPEWPMVYAVGDGVVSYSEYSSGETGTLSRLFFGNGTQPTKFYSRTFEPLEVGGGSVAAVAFVNLASEPAGEEEREELLLVGENGIAYYIDGAGQDDWEKSSWNEWGKYGHRPIKAGDYVGHIAVGRFR